MAHSLWEFMTIVMSLISMLTVLEVHDIRFNDDDINDIGERNDCRNCFGAKSSPEVD